MSERKIYDDNLIFEFIVLNDREVELNDVQLDQHTNELLIIPNEVEGKIVTSIGTQSLYLLDDVREVVFPNTVKTVKKEAIYGCSNLEYIRFNKGLEEIEDGAISGCLSLKEIVIPSTVKKMGHIFDAFNDEYEPIYYEGSSLAKLKVEKGNEYYDSRDNSNAIIETRSNKLIQGCKQSVIPNSVTTIGSRAFDSIDDLVFLVLPKSVKLIEKDAFRYCLNLDVIFYSGSEEDFKNIQVEGRYPAAFKRSYKEYNSNVTINDISYVKNINYTYYLIDNNIVSLHVLNKDIEEFDFNKIFPNRNVLSLGRSCFFNCKRIKSLILPNTIKAIGRSSIIGLSSLEKLILPNELEVINYYVFGGESICSIGNVKFNEYNNGLYLGSDKNPYLLFMHVKNNDVSELSVHEDTKFINTYAISSSSIKTIKLPNGLISIAAEGIDCCNLESINFPASMPYYQEGINNLNKIMHLDPNESYNYWE